MKDRDLINYCRKLQYSTVDKLYKYVEKDNPDIGTDEHTITSDGFAYYTKLLTTLTSVINSIGEETEDQEYG